MLYNSTYYQSEIHKFTKVMYISYKWMKIGHSRLLNDLSLEDSLLCIIGGLNLQSEEKNDKSFGCSR